MISYDKLKETVISLDFDFFDSGDYNINLIFERTNDTFTNYMTDLCHLAFKVGEHKQVISFKCSTKPGLIGSVLKPVTINGVTGTAVIVTPQQVKGGFKWIDKKTQDLLTFDNQDQFYRKKWNLCSFFREALPFKYYRDFDKDLEIDKVQLQNDIPGTHFHKGAEPININSLGCCTAWENDIKMIEPIIRQAVKNYGLYFTP